MISKRILISPLIIGLFMSVGCANQTNNQDEIPTAYEELYEIETEEISLAPIDEEVVEEEQTFSYEKISLDMLQVESEGNLLKFTNLTENYIREVSGKIIFLDENGNILRIDYAYLGNIISNGCVYYNDLGLPENYSSIVFEFEGIIIEKDLVNLKDNIVLNSNKNIDGDIFVKLSNKSDKVIKTIDIKVSLFKEDNLIYCETFSFDRNLGPSETTYEELYMGSYDYVYEYDNYEVDIEFASEESFVEDFNYWE